MMMEASATCARKAQLRRRRLRISFLSIIFTFLALGDCLAETAAAAASELAVGVRRAGASVHMFVDASSSSVA